MRGELPGPPISRLTGLHPTEAGLGKYTFSMPITRWLEDAFGLVWAGVFALLADAPLGTAIWTGLPPGKVGDDVRAQPLLCSSLHQENREHRRARDEHPSGTAGWARRREISDPEGRTMGYGTTRCLIADAPVTPPSSIPSQTPGPTIRRTCT